MKSLVAVIALTATFAQAADFPVAEKTGAAIQAAIDAAAAAGGGRVVVPAGVYPTGSLTLRSHVEVHLEKGAVVQGSAKYDDWGAFPESAMPKMYRALLHAYDAEDIALTGEGAFDGNGMAFFKTDERIFGRFYKGVAARPKILIMVRCRNVRFEGVSFLNPPSWTLHIIDSEHLLFRRAKLWNDLMCINCDGLDLDGCRHVRVEDCDFHTGDDALVVRAILWPGGSPRAVLEDIVVENCRFESACQCIRIGCSSDDTIRDVHFRNVTFRGFNGVNFDYPENYLHATDEGFLDAHDITFENVTGELDGRPIRVKAAPGVKLRGLRDVLFRNVTLTGKSPSVFESNWYSPMERFRFENVTLDGVRQPDGEVDVVQRNRNPLRRTKPGEYNYKPPADYVPQVYREVAEPTLAAVRSAIDAVVTNATGGVVVVPEGTYAGGGLSLPSRVELRLRKGAVLRMDGALAAEKAERVALTGPGVLEMAQPARFAGCRGVRLDGVTLKAPGKVSLVLRDCTDVAVDGVTARTEMRNCREVRGVAETGKIQCDR